MNTKKMLAAIFVCLFAMGFLAGENAIAAPQESGRKTITVRLNFGQPQKTVEIAELPRGRHDFLVTIQDINDAGTPGLDTIRLVNMDRKLNENYISWERPKEGNARRESINIARSSASIGMEFEAKPLGKWQGGSDLYVRFWLNGDPLEEGSSEP